MHATALIETNLGTICQSMHKARFKSLTVGVEAALSGKCVSVTGLGRNSPREEITEKAAIKQMDRLVGNEHLCDEATAVYRAMAHWIVQRELRPLILVDWSSISHDDSLHVLRASVPAGGRGKTLYQEVHPQAKYGNREVQRRFLEKLADVLPEGCRPIIVSDAGFKNPWFRAVASLGWDWIGRVRGTVQVSRVNGDRWLNATLLGHLLETDEQTFMGPFVLSKGDPLECAIHGLRKPPKGRIDKKKRGGRSQDSNSRKSAEREREPWVLATSLRGGAEITGEIIRAYARRMQIEESFRDTKDEYYGLGLNRSRSRSAERFTVLLLINALALFVAWLYGKVAEMRNLHRHYQANTVRSHRVLSHVFLGLRVLRRKGFRIHHDDLLEVRHHLGSAFQTGAAA